ncbi:hypothetical protein rerp_05320 [Rhodococcus erythropolis]|nr:hypothetical protein rerp_05320 [Rhodococcus erythropolis]
MQVKAESVNRNRSSECTGEEGDPVTRAGTDHNAARIDANASGAAQVCGEGVSEFDSASGISGRESVGRRSGQGTSGGRNPCSAGKRRRVRRSGEKAVGQAPSGRRWIDLATVCAGERGDHGSGTRPRDKPSSGGEFGIAVRNGVSGNSEIECEGARRRESGAGLQQSTVDRVAKRLKQRSANPDSLWQLDMQIEPKIGP